MIAQLYSIDILRLAANIPHLGSLAAPHARVERRSAVCGSWVVIDVRVDADGRVCAFAQRVNACALGQASAALLGGFVIGRSLKEVEDVGDALAALIRDEQEFIPELPALELFKAARGHSGRYSAILLPFQTASLAMRDAKMTLANSGTE